MIEEKKTSPPTIETYTTQTVNRPFLQRLASNWELAVGMAVVTGVISGAYLISAASWPPIKELQLPVTEAGLIVIATSALAYSISCGASFIRDAIKHK